MFIGVIVINTFESSCTAVLKENVEKYGIMAYDSQSVALMTYIIQYLLIWFAIKSFI